MRIVIQRVSRASVKVEDNVCGSIGSGLLILIGIEANDMLEDVKWLAEKSCNLRIFDDTQGVMNRSLLDIDGDALIVSQFTLHASTRKGNRPSYIRSAKSEYAIPIYQSFIDEIQSLLGKSVACGKFGARMQVDLINDGPVTIIIDSKNRE